MRLVAVRRPGGVACADRVAVVVDDDAVAEGADPAAAAPAFALSKTSVIRRRLHGKTR